MSKSKGKSRTWVEVFQAERKTFPQGYCATRVIPNKNTYSRKIKHKGKEWN